jgi:hypothetical protein
MTRLILALTMVAIMVSACGIKRPLMRPKDIPAYEKKRADKMKKFEAPTPTNESSGTGDPQAIDLNSPTPVPAVPQ